MRVLVFGGSGMLGHKLVQTLGPRFEVWTTLRRDGDGFVRFGLIEPDKIVSHLDVEDWPKVRETVELIMPDVIVNAIGIVKQHPSSKNVVKVLTVNSIFPNRLAELVESTGQKLITFGTDCVFDGAKGNYSESDKPDAVDLYGKSKNLGEMLGANTLTLRTSIIGRELNSSHGLVEWLLKSRGGSVKGFTNAVFSGFTTTAISRIVLDIIENHPDIEGLYHVSSEPISKFDLLRKVRDAYQIDIDIEPVDDPRIDRSLNSDKYRQATGFSPNSWDDMLGEMVSDPTPYELWRK